jgi:hypothetical protein
MYCFKMSLRDFDDFVEHKSKNVSVNFKIKLWLPPLKADPDYRQPSFTDSPLYRRSPFIGRPTLYTQALPLHYEKKQFWRILRKGSEDFQKPRRTISYRTIFKVLYKTIIRWYETVTVLYWSLMVLYRSLKVSHFLTESFFAVQNLKKRFCKRCYCEWVKHRTFKRFCRIFYRFFETLDTFGGFWKSTEPFRSILQNSFFSEQRGPHYRQTPITASATFWILILPNSNGRHTNKIFLTSFLLVD